MYTFQSSEELEISSGGVFGLNLGLLSKFEFNPNGGVDGAAQDCIDVSFKIGDYEFRRRFFPISRAYKGSEEITDTNSEDYKKEVAKQTKLLNATLCDIVLSITENEEALNTSLSNPISSFKDFATILEGLVKGVANWETKPVDVFLQYQWEPRPGKNTTYLEIPKAKNIVYGSWVCPSKGPGFKEVINEKGLNYVNDEGVAHPFHRGTWFMDNPYANRVTLQESNTGASDMNATSSGGW